MSFFTLSLSFPLCAPSYSSSFSGAFSLVCLLPPVLRDSSSRLTPMSIFPYRLIRKEASLPSLCTGFSFISLFFPFDPFFIRRANPPSPLPRRSTLAVSPLSIRSLQLLLLISFDVGYIKAFYTVFKSGLGLERFTVCFFSF